MTDRERDVKAAIRIALGGRPDTRLFNNPVGEAWLGRVAMDPHRHVATIYYPRRVVYGLAPGSSDLIGWHIVTIGPEHVGHRTAIFTAVECKSLRGRAGAEQRHFIDTVRAAGGIAGIAHSVEEAEAILRAGFGVAP